VGRTLDDTEGSAVGEYTNILAVIMRLRQVGVCVWVWVDVCACDACACVCVSVIFWLHVLLCLKVWVYV
jgi:hypothetical protein